MTARIIDGKQIAADIRNELKAEVESLKAKGITPGLGVILVGDDPASRSYVTAKERACEEIGLHSDDNRLAKETTQTELIALVDKMNALKLVELMQAGNIQIVKTATPPDVPASPKPFRNTILALITSGMLGIALAFVLDRFDFKIRSVSEVTNVIDRPILASIPTEPNLNGNIVTISHPKDAGAEAYRLLKTNLSYISPDQKAKKIMVTSPGPQEGKTTTITNLAVTLARGGSNVAVVELDFRRPSLSRQMALTNIIGITNVIAGTHTLEDVIQVIDKDSLVVVNEFSKHGNVQTMKDRKSVV